jgi:sulfite exporter TauE/SafE
LSDKIKKRIYITAAVLIIIAAAMAAVFNGTELTQFFTNLFYLKYLPDLTSNVSLWTLLLFGLLTSIHCMGMCGGLVLSQCVGLCKPGDTADTQRKSGRAFIPAACYNAGRLISYTIIGAVVGGVGQVLSLPQFMKGLIPIAGGIFMVIMAVNLLGIFPKLKLLNIRPPKFIAKKVLRGSGKSPFIIGLMTGFMPCGPLQIVELYALGTKSIFYGAASMFVFALGTVPGLFAFGAAGSLLNRRFQKAILRISAVVVAVLGIIMIGRGLSLEGITPPSLSGSAKSSGGYAVSVVNGNSQTVTIKIGENYYPPIEVKKGIPVRWIIHVDKDVYCDCNNEIMARSFGIDKKLVVGDNVVCFTPDRTGDFVYTCWMGMIKSTIHVVDSGSAAANGNAAVSAAQSNIACTSSCTPSGSHETAAAQTIPTAPSAPHAQKSNAPSAHAVKASSASSTQQPTAFTGYLIDEDCFVRSAYKNPADETGGCLTMPSCAASGYGLAVKQRDGSYKFYYFDGNIAADAGDTPKGATGGQKAAWNFINSSIPDGNIAVKVSGTLSGKTCTNPDIDSADGKFYPVLTVSSISKQ